ncbi:FAD dependent oxidoreductase [Crucibulum laeve]|uniref:FAD dependent oxidoreductase n=1 Tax=Crucibulum laeve TaxID=68775 RepID=A0A5C3LSF9_9AGAR|nr:FAD dependent oxidoreductase [Crucibulum laeve]
MSSTQSREIVIIGGGIIGCTTAYYLSCHPSSTSAKIILIEASEHGPAQGASGKAGGLVAKWAYPRELVDISFSEHVKLAQEHNGKDRWGWRFVGCGSWEGKGEVSPSEAELGTGVGRGGTKKSLEKTFGLVSDDGVIRDTKVRKSKGLPDDLLWVKDDLTDSYSPMATEGGTAQVHPYQFTTSMFDLAKENGVAYINGRVKSVTQADGKVTGIEYVEPTTNETKTIPASQVILAAGAWSPKIIPQLPISATRAHSITIHPKPSITISPYVLFTEITLPSTNSQRGKIVSPEIYARPDNEVYACGPGDDSLLPETVDDVLVDEAACDSIHKHVASISQELREGTVDKRQACFLPIVSSGGGPIVGEASTIAKGLYIATGHTCWGICNAPGTARAITELVMDGKIKCANLKKLSPSVLL